MSNFESQTTTAPAVTTSVAPTPGVTIGGTPTTVEHGSLTNDAVMYFSRQLALFDENITKKLLTHEAVVKSIESIKVHSITHLNDFVKDCPRVDNEFRRIRYQLSNKQKQQQRELADQLHHHSPVTNTTTTGTVPASTANTNTNTKTNET